MTRLFEDIDEYNRVMDEQPFVRSWFDDIRRVKADTVKELG